MANFDDLMKIDPHHAMFFLKLVGSEIDEKKEREQVLDRIAHNFLVSRQLIKTQNIDLFAVRSVESLEDLIDKTHRGRQEETEPRSSWRAVWEK